MLHPLGRARRRPWQAERLGVIAVECLMHFCEQTLAVSLPSRDSRTRAPVRASRGYPTGEGRLYHFDGTTWTNITDTLSTLVGGPAPVTTTIFGTGADDIWIPLADGRVLRYTR
jgi:hypothetical protein